MASLHAHAAYLRALATPDGGEPREFLESLARAAGTGLGTHYATAFEVLRV